MFVGYDIGYKGYKLYNLQTRTFFISRDVVFHENTFPFHNLPHNDQMPDLFPDLVLPKPLPDITSEPVLIPITTQNSPDTTTVQPPNEEPQPQSVVDNPPSLVIATPLRRSTRTPNPPSYLSQYQCHNVSQYPIQQYLSHAKLTEPYAAFINQISSFYEPQFYHQAVKHPEWQKAMQLELEALELNNTWSLVPLPKGKHTIGCKWVYKVKTNPDGSLDKHKARLVAKGYTQQAGIDFKDTFSPVAKLTTVRVHVALAAIKGWQLLQLDINNAFLNGDLLEEVYMDMPLGYKLKGEQLVCKLNKSIYGLR